MKKLLCILLVCACFVSIFTVSALPTSAATNYRYSAPKVWLANPTDNGIHMYFDLKPGVTRYRLYYRDFDGDWTRAGSDYVVSSAAAHTGKCVDRVINIGNNIPHGYQLRCTLRYLNATGSAFLSDYRESGYIWRKAPDVNYYSVNWDGNRNFTRLALTVSDNYNSGPLGYTIFARNSSTGFTAIARHCHGRSHTFSSSELRTINNLLRNHGHVVFTVRECLDYDSVYCSTYWDSAVTLYKTDSGRYAATDWNTNL